LVIDQKADETGVKEVLNYFLRNPHAADSLEGIARWRLLEEAVRRKVDETQRALAWLVNSNFIIVTTVAGADPIFCLNPDKLAEAEAFLACGKLFDEDEKP
jgi:hypothetical protein